jgi:hypothetical protein
MVWSRFNFVRLVMGQIACKLSKLRVEYYWSSGAEARPV